MLIKIASSRRGHKCDCCRVATATYKHTSGIFVQLVCEECKRRYWWRFGIDDVVSEDAESVWLRNPGLLGLSGRTYRCCKSCGERWENCSCGR